MTLKSPLTSLLVCFVLFSCGEDPGGGLQTGMATPKGTVLVAFQENSVQPYPPGEFHWTVKGNGDSVLKFGVVSNEGKGNLMTVGDFDFGSESRLEIICRVAETEEENGKHCAVTVEFKHTKSGDQVHIQHEPTDLMIPTKNTANAATDSIQSHLRSEQLLSIGDKGVLAWWQSRNDRDTWIPDGGKEGLEVFVDGKTIPIKDYEFPAWALWLEVKAR